MKKLNVLQKLIAHAAVCLMLAAILAFSGSGYALWAFDSESMAATAQSENTGAVTVWYRKVTIYSSAPASEDKILWTTDSYPSGTTISLDYEVNGVKMNKSVYNFLSTVTMNNRGCLADSAGNEVAHFVSVKNVTPANKDNYFQTGPKTYWELLFYNAPTADKDYEFFVVYS